MYVYICKHRHKNKHKHVRTTHTHMHAYSIVTHSHTGNAVEANTYIHTYIHTHTHTQEKNSGGITHTYIHTYIHTYTHTHIQHTHIHTQTGNTVEAYHIHTYTHTYTNRKYSGGTFKFKHQPPPVEKPTKAPDIMITLDVQLLDLYTGAEFNASFTRQEVCSKCNGTGAEHKVCMHVNIDVLYGSTCTKPMHVCVLSSV